MYVTSSWRGPHGWAYNSMPQIAIVCERFDTLWRADLQIKFWRGTALGSLSLTISKRRSASAALVYTSAALADRLFEMVSDRAVII